MMACLTGWQGGEFAHALSSRTSRWVRACVRVLFVALAILCTLPASNVSAEQLPGRPPGPSVTGPGNALGNNSSSEIWRQIRRGFGGTVSLPGKEQGVLIQSEGELWRAWRNGVISAYGGWILAGIVAVIALYFVIRGRIRIQGGRTGNIIPRFSMVQRVAHWFAAILWILLGVSGLILLFGKYVLLPILGPSLFAAVASASMHGHNLFGPLFIPALLGLFVYFLRGNGFRKVDLEWAIKGGGFLGGHASSYKYNFGEKSWFWWAIILGLVLCITGMALLFPWAMPGRDVLQIASLLHAGAAILFIAFGIGHIYLGTAGMEGALEGMTRGVVDENWAKEHHDLWYEEHKSAATTDQSRAEVEAAAGNV